MAWNAMELNKIKRTGMDLNERKRNEREWNMIERNGMEQNGTEWKRVLAHDLHSLQKSLH